MIVVGNQRVVVLNGLVILEWNPPPGIGIDGEAQVYVHLGPLVHPPRLLENKNEPFCSLRVIQPLALS